MRDTVRAVYFSPTHTTQKVVRAVAKGLCHCLGAPLEEIDVTFSNARMRQIPFTENEVLVLGFPVYGGRVPRVLESWADRLTGGGALAVACAVYGNREYDDALLEMQMLLEKRGFRVAAAGAFIGEHSFSRELAAGRPDFADLEQAVDFGRQAAEKIVAGNAAAELVIKGNYPFQDRGQALALAPATNEDCYHCGLCARGCPVGAIDFDAPHETNADKCLRCCACVKFCPVSAKSFDHHQPMLDARGWLESSFMVPRQPEIFL